MNSKYADCAAAMGDKTFRSSLKYFRKYGSTSEQIFEPKMTRTLSRFVTLIGRVDDDDVGVFLTDLESLLFKIYPGQHPVLKKERLLMEHPVWFAAFTVALSSPRHIR